MPAVYRSPEEFQALIDRDLGFFSAFLARLDPLGGGIDVTIEPSGDMALLPPDPQEQAKNRALSPTERTLLGGFARSWALGQIRPDVPLPRVVTGTDLPARVACVAPYARSVVDAWMRQPTSVAYFSDLDTATRDALLALINTYVLSTLLRLHADPSRVKSPTV